MQWSIQGFGEHVPADNACWTFLVHIEVLDNGTWKKVNKEDMRVGQEGYALFKSGAGKSQCEVRRTA